MTKSNQKNDFKKVFFKLLNNTAIGKTMENVKRHRDIKLATTEARRNYLVSEPKCHATKKFSENLYKPAYFGLSIL